MNEKPDERRVLTIDEHSHGDDAHVAAEQSDVKKKTTSKPVFLAGKNTRRFGLRGLR
jgi:hypothetical protein